MYIGSMHNAKLVEYLEILWAWWLELFTKGRDILMVRAFSKLVRFSLVIEVDACALGLWEGLV